MFCLHQGRKSVCSSKPNGRLCSHTQPEHMDSLACANIAAATVDDLACCNALSLDPCMLQKMHGITGDILKATCIKGNDKSVMSYPALLTACSLHSSDELMVFLRSPELQNRLLRRCKARPAWCWHELICISISTIVIIIAVVIVILNACLLDLAVFIAIILNCFWVCCHPDMTVNAEPTANAVTTAHADAEADAAGCTAAIL